HEGRERECDGADRKGCTGQRLQLLWTPCCLRSRVARLSHVSFLDVPGGPASMPTLPAYLRHQIRVRRLARACTGRIANARLRGGYLVARLRKGRRLILR